MGNTTTGSSFSSFLNILGLGADVLLNIWGIEEEKSQQQKLLEQRRIELAQEAGFQRQQLGLSARQQKLAEQQAAFGRREARRRWKWMEEERNYGRMQDFTNRFMGMLDRNQPLKNNLVSIWGKRG